MVQSDSNTMFRCPLCGCVSRERIIDPKRTPEAIEAHIGLHDKIAALERERDKLLQELGNLLAIIHRDGGHYMSKHGVKKAIEDAHTIWAGLIDLEADNATLRKRLDSPESNGK